MNTKDTERLLDTLYEIQEYFIKAVNGESSNRWTYEELLSLTDKAIDLIIYREESNV